MVLIPVTILVELPLGVRLCVKPALLIGIVQVFPFNRLVLVDIFVVLVGVVLISGGHGMFHIASICISVVVLGVRRVCGPVL